MNQMISGIWENVNTIGATPDTREGCAGQVLHNFLFIFGGFSRDLYSDLRKIDLVNGKRWILY